MHAREGHSPRKKEGILAHVTAQINGQGEDIVLMSQRKTNTSWFPFHVGGDGGETEKCRIQKVPESRDQALTHLPTCASTAPSRGVCAHPCPQPLSMGRELQDVLGGPQASWLEPHPLSSHRQYNLHLHSL